MISQFIVETTFKKKGTLSIFTKVLLQMIAKLRNILWISPSPKPLENTKTCIMGIDTSSSKGVTVMAGCGTTNSTFTLHCSQSKKMNKNEEKYNDMIEIASKIIEGYAERNKIPPE